MTGGTAAATALVARPSANERFLSAIVPEPMSGCWLWSGILNEAGYGRFTFKCAGRKYQTMAHRLAYEVLVGPIPAGLVIDHVCRNRACVNPDHLEPVTHAENSRRGVHPLHVAGRLKVCLAGHPVAGTNAAKGGQRRPRVRCRICENALHRARYRRSRVAA